MKILAQLVTILSLAVCLAVAISRFFDLTSYGSYTTILGISSVVYFLAATTWAEMRR
jgi:hypothetical protein